MHNDGWHHSGVLEPPAYVKADVLFASPLCMSTQCAYMTG